MPEDGDSTKKITKDELILAELKGKNEAIGRYDTILWRVRSSYVIVLYGSLLLFTGKEGGIAAIFEKMVVIWPASTTIFVLSFILACMDAGFRLRQLRVVDAYNRLSDIAYAFAADKEVQVKDLTSLLRISGEGKNPNSLLRRIRTVIVIGLLYLGPPLIVLAGLTAHTFMDRALNTNGGGLSYMHSGMYGMNALQESVRQMRGTAPPKSPAPRSRSARASAACSPRRAPSSCRIRRRSRGKRAQLLNTR